MGEDTRDYKYVTGAEQRLSIVDKVPFCSSWYIVITETRFL